METNDFIDLLHYKIGYRIYSLLGYKNHSNIILYGKEGSGKSLLIKTTIKDIYDLGEYEFLGENIILDSKSDWTAPDGIIQKEVCNEKG